jgi:hypothetical protein
MQLHGVPQTPFGFALIFRAHQHVDVIVAVAEQLEKNVRADISGGTCEKNSH